MAFRTSVLLLVPLLAVAGCDAFASDTGEFEAQLTGGVSRSYVGGEARVGSAGGVKLETEFSTTDGARFHIDWAGGGVPPEGVYPVVSRESRDRPGDSFTARAVLETEGVDLRLSAIDGQVTVTESGEEVRATAELTMTEDSEATDEVDAQISFRAVLR